jgi:hypothetical protein
MTMLGNASTSGVGAATPATARVLRSRHILLETQFDALVNRLATLRPPLTANTTSSEVRALADHLLEIAAAVDYYIGRVGRELAYNAPCAIESGLFVDQLRGALEGNATFEINRVADILAEDEP